MAYVTYTAKREIEPTGFSKTGTDFSSISSDDSFNAATTNISGLLTDQWLQAAGFVRNAGWFQVKSNSTGSNLLTKSQEFDHANWLKTNASVSANATTAPDGTSTADKLVEDNTTNIHVIAQTLAKSPAAIQCTFSVYVKPGGRDTVILQLQDGATVWASTHFNAATGTVISTDLGTATITVAANGFYRCTITGISTVLTPLIAIVYLTNGSAASYAGNGTSGAFLWGAQLEFASAASAYVATTTAAIGGKILTLTPPVTHLRLPGVAGNYASTPDAAANSVTGDLELIVRAALIDWTPAIQALLISKWITSGNQRSYGLSVNTNGTLNLSWSADGTAVISKDSTVATGIVDGAIKYVRATLDVNNGAAGNDVKFYTSDDGVVWTQLGSTVTTAGTTAVFDSTAVLEVGSFNAGATNLAIGRIYYASLVNGLGGSTVAAFDPTRGTRGAGSLVALTGEIWTINTSGTPPALLQGPLLTYEGAEYLNGCSYASTPDSAANSLTGSIELTVKAALTDWTTASYKALIAKDDAATQRSYQFVTDQSSTGKLIFLYTTDGSTGRVATSTAAVPFADGSTGWVKVTYNSGTGTVQFFTSSDGAIFTQLGTNVALTAGAIFDSTTALTVGNLASLGEPQDGKIYYAEVRNGIGGPIIAAFDPGRAAAGAGSLVAYTGEVWTINAPAALVRTTPITITGYKRGYGQSYSIEFKAEAVDRKVKFKRNEQRPIGGGAAEVLFQYSDAVVDVMTEILSEVSQVPQFREFLASVAAGEIFTFDRYGTIASPVDPRQAQLESVGYDEQRVMSTMQQRIPFSVRLLS